MYITEFLSKKIDQKNLRHTPFAEWYEIILPRFEECSAISKNFFQIYLTGHNTNSQDVMSKLTPSFIGNIDKLKKNNPEYVYHLISDQEAKEFILQHYGAEIWRYYLRIDSSYLAARADFLRYLLLYAWGGVYLDLKSTIEHPLSKTIREDDRFLLFYWDNTPGGQHHFLIPDYITKGEMLQAFIISARGHGFLRAVILNVLRQIDLYNPFRNGVGFAGILTTTGPAIYTETIYKTMANDMCEQVYREGKPWAEFGFKVYFAGEYVPGSYQSALSMKNYRKNSRPVIQCDCAFLNLINVVWLRVLHTWRKIKGLPI